MPIIKATFELRGLSLLDSDQGKYRVNLRDSFLLGRAESCAEEAAMLKELNRDQVEFVALLAKSARIQRDAFIAKVPEDDMAEVKPGRGEHNPIGTLGFAALPAGASEITALRDAIAALSSAGRSELYALMRLGQGDLAAKKWHRGIVEAETLGDDTVIAALTEDPDLHDHLMKGLYEAKLAS